MTKNSEFGLWKSQTVTTEYLQKEKREIKSVLQHALQHVDWRQLKISLPRLFLNQFLLVQ